MDLSKIFFMVENTDCVVMIRNVQVQKFTRQPVHWRKAMFFDVENNQPWSDQLMQLVSVALTSPPSNHGNR